MSWGAGNLMVSDKRIKAGRNAFSIPHTLLSLGRKYTGSRCLLLAFIAAYGRFQSYSLIFKINIPLSVRLVLF